MDSDVIKMVSTERKGNMTNKYIYDDDEDDDVDLCTCQHFDLFVKSGKVSVVFYYV